MRKGSNVNENGYAYSFWLNKTNENEKHEIHVPTHNFTVVNHYVLFVELASLALLSN